MGYQCPVVLCTCKNWVCLKSEWDRASLCPSHRLLSHQTAMAEALLSTHTPSYAFTASKAVITEAEMQFIVSLNYCGTASAGPVTIH